MERKVYEQMAQLDSRHWWFTARRRILDGVIERVVKPPKDARILELGAGTGHNLAMLSRFGTVEASELDPIARQLASDRLGRPVVEAALPDLSMFQAGSYDLVALLDVLEHVPDDEGSLRSIKHLLKPGAALLLTVPIKPIFGPSDTVFTMGSCFAERIRISLTEQGVRVGPPSCPWLMSQ